MGFSNSSRWAPEIDRCAILSPGDLKVMQILSKILFKPTFPVFANGFARPRVFGDIFRGMWWLLLAVGLAVAGIMVSTNVSEAHDQAFCDSNDGTHYIEDVVANPPGRFMMYASSPHDHLIVKAGTGVSGVSVERSTSKTFDYLGYDVDVGSDLYVYEITFTTSQADAVVKLCFEDGLGLWWPYPIDANGDPVDDNDEARDTEDPISEVVTNSGPTTQGLPMPRQDVEKDVATYTFDVGGYFADPDNDTLSYMATPADSTKVTVSVSGSVLTLDPQATGVTTVTVTASDGFLTVDASFTVVVYDEPPLRTTTEASGIVSPDEESVVTSAGDGDLKVTFPSGTMTSYYQARLDPESDDCGTEAPQGSVYLCLSVDLFDLAANSITGTLSANAKMALELDATQYSSVSTELTNSNFNLYKGTTGDWDEIMECTSSSDTSLCFDLVSVGSAGRIEVKNISSFSDFTSSIPVPEEEPETVVQPPPTQTPSTRGNSGGGGGVSSRSSNLRPTLDIAYDTLRYRENGTEPVAEFDADDPDNDNLEWGIEGPDRKAFRISNKGVLTFRAPPDYENPGDRDGDNEYEITVMVEDDGSPSRSDNEDVSIRVTNENELSEISGDAEISIAEGQTGDLGQYAVEDPEGDEISWTLTGADADDFGIDQQGNLSLESELDYEGSSAAGTDVYEVTVTASDDGRPQMSSQLNVSLTVTNVNEAPVSSAIPRVGLTVGGSGATLDLDSYFTDPDGDALGYAVAARGGADVVSVTLNGSILTLTPVGVGTHSLEVMGSDAGGLSASATVSAEVLEVPVVRPIISGTPIHDEIVRPYSEHFAEPAAFLGVNEIPPLAPILWMIEAEEPVVEEPRGPVASVSYRFVPEVRPEPTVIAVVELPRAPTATPVPISTPESRRPAAPTPAATQAVLQEAVTPEAARPAEAPVGRTPAAPTATAVPAPATQAADSDEDDGTGLPLWLIILLILVGLFVLASLPIWVVNVVVVTGLIGLAIVLVSVAFWAVILVAVGVMVLLAAIGLVYGIVTRGW